VGMKTSESNAATSVGGVA